MNYIFKISHYYLLDLSRNIYNFKRRQIKLKAYKMRHLKTKYLNFK